MRSFSRTTATKCFLEHQLVKPTMILLAFVFAALVGWIGVTHFQFATKRLAQGPSGDRAVLGIQVVAPDELVARMFSFPPGEAVMVSHVAENSPAQRAGIRRGDGIVAIQGHSIRSTNDVAAMTEQVKQGDLLRLTVVRGGLVQNIVLALGAGPGG